MYPTSRTFLSEDAKIFFTSPHTLVQDMCYSGVCSNQQPTRERPMRNRSAKRVEVMKSYQGLGLIKAVEMIRAEVNAFKGEDARYQMVWSAIENGNDTLWEIKPEGLAAWFDARPELRKDLPADAGERDMKELAFAYITYGGICSNSCYYEDFGGTARDQQWLWRRGFIG